MQGQQQPHDGTDDQPTSELDIYKQATDPTERDQFLQDVNFGLGNYTRQEHWQQVESYRNYVFADSAFSDRLLELAIYETKVALGERAYSAADEETLADLDADTRRKQILELGEEVFDDLGQDQYDEAEWQQMNSREREFATLQAQQDAIEQETGITGEWTPPHGRMMQVRHEASRSIGARLLDNIFGRVQEFLDESSSEEEMDRLGGGVR